MFDLKLTKEQQLMVLGVAVSLVVGCCVLAVRSFAPQTAGIVIEEPTVQPAIQVQSMVLVHVSGAVRREGVYRLGTGYRVLDALKLAGGAGANADLSAINLAEVVKDGVKIIIPGKQIIERGSGEPGTKGLGDRGTGGSGNSKVSLNNADVKALDALPGIGKSTAQKIVEYRLTNGPFTKIEQIMEIPRFGKSKFEKIKDRLTL
jgi:competence protein ComEA